MSLKTLSLDERLAYFYCCYVGEEAIDPEVDAEAVKLWEKISSSKRKRHERICTLLQQIENVSIAQVVHLDTSFKSKRELLLLAEGTLGNVRASKKTTSDLTAQRDTAKFNNEMFLACGALPLFTQNLLRSLLAFRSLNFQHLDVDAVETMVRDLQQDMSLMYLLILFNGTKRNVEFEGHLFMLGSTAPTQALMLMLECLNHMNALPGFPIKRLLLLFYEWFQIVLGTSEQLEEMKRLRAAQDEIAKLSLVEDDVQLSGLRCKTHAKTLEEVPLEASDPYYLQKKKFEKERLKIHDRYRHRAFHELKKTHTDEQLDDPTTWQYQDEEWETRCEVVYQLFLPRMREYTALLTTLITVSSGAAMNVRDKSSFFSRRPSNKLDPNGYGTSTTSSALGVSPGAEYSSSPVMTSPMENPSETQFWRWLLREKTIVVDVACLLVLLIGKHFHASHVMKSEYYFQFYVEANLVATLTKFMNKDLAAYLQVNINSTTTSSSGMSQEDATHQKSGFYALENELQKLSIQFDDNMSTYSVQCTRAVTSVLRILQKLTKRKPNMIKNALCRSSSIVWLKRVVSLRVPLPRLYALKLVKSQAKYLGHQWLRKYTCFNLLTEIYLNVRPELDDNWLQYEEDDPSKAGVQDVYERWLFGEIQAYHYRYYWENPSSKGASTGSSGSDIYSEARKDLEKMRLDLDGGRVNKMYNEIKLDSVHFCQQYDKWLDQEGILAASQPQAMALPISFH